MEIIFLLISIILSIVFIYLIGRIVHDTHSQLVRAYKRNEEFIYFHLFMAIMLSLVFFITLCAFNNTFWHLPYYFK